MAVYFFGVPTNGTPKRKTDFQSLPECSTAGMVGTAGIVRIVQKEVPKVASTSDTSRSPAAIYAAQRRALPNETVPAHVGKASTAA